MSYPTLNFALGETIDMLRDQVQAFVAAELAPRAAQTIAGRAGLYRCGVGRQLVGQPAHRAGGADGGRFNRNR